MFGPCLFLAALCLLGMALHYSHNKYGTWEVWGFFCIVFFALSLLFWVAYGWLHVSGHTTLSKLSSDKLVYEQLYRSVGTQFVSEVGKYVEHEGGVFEAISPEQAKVYLAKYPELRSIEAVTILMNRLSELQEQMWQVELDRNSIVRTIKLRQAYPFLYGWLPHYDDMSYFGSRVTQKEIARLASDGVHLRGHVRLDTTGVPGQAVRIR